MRRLPGALFEKVDNRVVLHRAVIFLVSGLVARVIIVHRRVVSHVNVLRLIFRRVHLGYDNFFLILVERAKFFPDWLHRLARTAPRRVEPHQDVLVVVDDQLLERLSNNLHDVTVLWEWILRLEHRHELSRFELVIEFLDVLRDLIDLKGASVGVLEIVR